MKAKTITAYIIKEPTGALLPNTIRLNSRDSKQSYIGFISPWPEWYKTGFRCVKVQITEVKPK